MRLLHIDTVKLHEYASAEDAPPYIITSHRWLDGEVSLQEVLRRDRDPTVDEKAGMRKIKAFCEFAKAWRDSYERPAPSSEPQQIIPSHVWIDTCCINKESSAELQEAITSMFQWYRQAWCCLAFLHVVETASHSPLEVLHSLKQSVWFTCGWTLQELLAPKCVIFLDASWVVIGHKSHHEPLMTLSHEVVTWRDLKVPLNNYLSQITNIDELILWDYDHTNRVGFEDRLAWMLRRTTTRPEDRAYCILGVCEVYMPLIYGEGKNALKRLHREIRAEHGVDFKDSGQVQVPNLTPHQRRLHAMTFGSPSVEQMPRSSQHERGSSLRPSDRPGHEMENPLRGAERRETQRPATSLPQEQSKQRQPLSAPAIHEQDANLYWIPPRDDQIREALHEYFMRVEKGHVWADDRGFVNVSDILGGSRLRDENVTFDELIEFVKTPAGKSFKIHPTAFANEFSYSSADFEIKLADESDNADPERSQSVPGGSSWPPPNAEEPSSPSSQPITVRRPYQPSAERSVPSKGNHTDYTAMISALDDYFDRKVDSNDPNTYADVYVHAKDLLQAPSCRSASLL
ncbi:hypothetical protein CBER1_09752 [Cercospora berteroae]|uniref:Heterokaryon incompatibility domain-containing protein n=1 Tax=Cercospora berteroae TaxID=357750 RepID=A0A2S6BXI8_9PEZI|nr:hypothetical protein CBER1_09752 [Cercospora berteroae]